MCLEMNPDDIEIKSYLDQIEEKLAVKDKIAADIKALEEKVSGAEGGGSFKDKAGLAMAYRANNEFAKAIEQVRNGVGEMRTKPKNEASSPPFLTFHLARTMPSVAALASPDPRPPLRDKVASSRNHSRTHSRHRQGKIERRGARSRHRKVQHFRGEEEGSREEEEKFRKNCNHIIKRSSKSRKKIKEVQVGCDINGKKENRTSS